MKATSRPTHPRRAVKPTHRPEPTHIISKPINSTPARNASFQPGSNRVLVRKEAENTNKKTHAGIILPSSKSKGADTRAYVVDVGPGLRDKDGKFVPTFVRPGDQVLLPEFGGVEVNINDQTFHLYRDDDILGRFTGDSKQ